MLLVCIVVLPLRASANDDGASFGSVFFETTETTESGATNTTKYSLISLEQDGKVCGVRFVGFYFGSSGIQVTAEIYSSDDLVIDFDINEQENNLTAAQLAVKARIATIFDQVDALIDRIDECANASYDGEDGYPTSDIFRYNNAACGDTLEISSDTYQMLLIAREMYEQTSGAFNPTVYRLVDLWGFSSRIFSNGDFDTEKYPYDRPVSADEFSQNGYPLPDEKYIEAFSDDAFVDFSQSAVKLSEKDGKFYVTKNVSAAVVDGVEFGQWLDLGGIAKGYSVDLIKALFKQNDISRYYVDAGSSSSAFGLSVDGGSNTLQIADPFTETAAIFPETLLGYEVGVCTVSTSGQYVRRYVTDGVEYSHIIDSSTGAPAQTGVKLVSVSVSDGDEFSAAKSDCLTTALTVLGKDKIVEMMNGYLKENDIKVVVAFETVSGEDEICSNLSRDELTVLGENFRNYAWTVDPDENGVYVYNEHAVAIVSANNVVVIVIVCVCVLVVAAAVIFRFFRHRDALETIGTVRKSKPFKPADIGVYMLVALLVAVLFAAFLGGSDETFQVVRATDIETGEELFVYNVSRDDYEICSDSANGWEVEVRESENTLEVTFSREIDGETHFNTLRIICGSNPSVRMTDSLCGFHRDCVVSFGEVTMSGGVIVCSPNRLKITTS